MKTDVGALGVRHQSFAQARIAITRLIVLDSHRQRTFAADEDDEMFGARNAGVE